MQENSTNARQYSKSKTRLTVIELIVTMLFLTIMLFSGISLRLKDLVAGWSGNFYLQVGSYLAIFSGICYLLLLGLDFYGGFLLEHRYSLSNQTVFAWLKKNTKKALLSLLLVLAAGEVLYFLLRNYPKHWWLLTTAAWLLLTIVLGRITPVLIIPLFYKCIPLADRELREKLVRLGQECGLRIKEVFEINLSKDTQKANAAVAGLGKSQRILLGDTLLKNYSNDEIEAIFAHELGHIREHHIRKMLAFGATVSLVSFYLTSLLFNAGISFFGFSKISDVSAFPLLALIMMVVGLLLMPIQLAYLRHLERQSDMFAIAHIEKPQSFASAMKKLANQNLADPSPSRLEELLLYDHPPVSKRLRYTFSKEVDSPEEQTA